MVDDLRDLIGDGFAAPLGDVIAAVGRGVAEAQAALDRASLDATLAVYEADGDAGATLLRDIGYRPTFYVLPETACEVHVSMRVGGSGGADGSANAGARTYVTPVDAGFANRFGYAASASARLTFKIVPVPPPAAFDDNRPVPQLLGGSGADAATRLAGVGLVAAFVDKEGRVVGDADAAGAMVVAQTPAALGLVPLGGTVRLAIG
jgi:hypothetical protein